MWYFIFYCFFARLKCDIILQYFNNFKRVHFNTTKMFNKIPLPFINQNILGILASEKYFEMLILILYHMSEFNRKLTFPPSLFFWLFRIPMTDKLNCQWNVFIHLYLQYCRCLLCFPLSPYFSSAAWKWVSVCLFSKVTVKGRAGNCRIKIFVRKTCLF